jgi:hypothetical protein
MAHPTVSRGATVPISTTVAAVLDEYARAFSALFEITTPLERERLAHRLVLVALLCVGAFARFWELGAVGLHGDEETMAMATMHIVRDGLPILPSGMFYPRGLTELYLMAGAVQIFGESEWALRLPSVLCGIVLIVLAWTVGRRFLRPEWNCAFTAAVAFLPEILEYSQTARMYIFLLVGVAACLACIFAWERSDRLGWLVLAALALIVGIELHALAVTNVLLFLFPGLLRGDMRRLLLGIVTAALVMLAWVGIDAWVSAQYPVPPPEYAADLGPPRWDRGHAPQAFDLTFDIVLWIVGLAAAFFAVHVVRRIASRPAAIVTAVLLLAGLFAQLMVFYHLAALFFVAGVVVARRYGGPMIWRRLWIFALGSGLLALIHGSLLASTPGSVVKLIGALVGEPSVWPYWRIMEFSLVAGALVVLCLASGLVRLATGRPVRDYWLFAVLGVWIPLFVIGMFLWNVPARYTVASMLPWLLCAFATAQSGADWLAAKLGWLRTSPGRVAAIAAVAALVINPGASVARVNSGYGNHPDHKGAAEFMRTQNIGPDDIVLAEDVLEQTYYLGSVDYWLISRSVARRFVTRINGEICDFYTGTPVIGSAKMLEDLMQREAGRRIFIIGSGENMADGRKTMRGDIDDVLDSDRVQVIYTGRDGVTKVWRAVPVAR